MAVLAEQITTGLIWAMVVFVIGSVLIAFAFGILFMSRYFKYKIKLDIYEKVGDGYQSFAREAKEVIHKVSDMNGKRRTYLLLRVPYKGKNKIDLPASASYIPHGTIFATKKKLNLMFTDGIFAPLHIQQNSPEVLNFNPKDLLRVLDSWDQDYAENLETHKAKPGFWDKYQQFITILSVIGMTMIFWILIFVITTGGGAGSPQQIT